MKRAASMKNAQSLKLIWLSKSKYFQMLSKLPWLGVKSMNLEVLLAYCLATLNLMKSLKSSVNSENFIDS